MDIHTPESKGIGRLHISGAEGIFYDSEITKISAEFIKRALTHSRGKADRVVLTIEKITEKPVRAALLPVMTSECSSPAEAWALISRQMQNIGISQKALNSALKIVSSEKTMRGAALIAMRSGRRLERDRARGVRVSRLGIDRPTSIRLSRWLSSRKINTATVREALILASKVASCKDVVAEICVSDDPDYTTGYIASRSLGYMRITGIKDRGGMNGGRVFFVKDDADAEAIALWLETTPVMVESPNEKKNNTHR